MTKKHFEAIAAMFAKRMDNPTIPSEARQALIALANEQADYFESVNERFSRDTFLFACGMR